MNIIVLNSVPELKERINNALEEREITPEFLPVSNFNENTNEDYDLVFYYLSFETINDYLNFKRGTLSVRNVKSVPFYLITMSMLETELDQILISSEDGSLFEIVPVDKFADFILKHHLENAGKKK